MRLLMTCATLVLAAAGGVQAQRPVAASPLDRTVTLTLEGVPLKHALDEVARQAGVRIAYSRRVVPLERSVSVRLDTARVQTALDTLLHGTGVASTLDRSGQILLVTGSRQTGSVSGTILDAATAAPLAGVSVILVGTRLTAETQADGRYTIAEVPPATYRLRARLLGYTPADTSIAVQDGQATVVNFQLRRGAIELNPVVAIGYAAVEKRDLTGAVSSLTAEQFATKAAPTVTLSSGLQGKAPGVQVTSNTGMPGGGVRVRIRGTGSITANSEPLYVIDGVPAEQGTRSTDPKANPLMSIDADAIESIDVLKDASATAIYGARGANGVVLITTRRGRRGESRITLETSAGYQQISKTIPVLSGPEFMQLSNEARANAGRTLLYTDSMIAAAPTYDYPAMMLRTAPQATQSLTFSGGDQRLRYLLSGNFTTQQGIEIGSDFRRYGGRLNVDADMSPRFRLGTSLSFTRVSRNAPSVENGSLGNSANGIQAAMEFAPFSPPRNPDGTWVKTSPTTEPVPNPLANATELTDLNTTSRLLGSAFAELDLTPALRVRSTVGGNFQFDGIHNFAPRTILAGGFAGTGWIFSSQARDLTNENTVTYRRAFGPGNVDVLGGFSVQTSYNESVRGDGAIFATDVFNVYNLGSSAQFAGLSSGASKSAILSYLGRAQYNVADRYILTLTGRYDGSSRFGVNHKWAFFPSGAFAWRMSDEGFMRGQSIFNDLKVRVSYGEVGNQAVDPYQSLWLLGVGFYSFGTTEVPALTPGGNKPNPNLKWEQRTELNAGIDAALFDNRVSVTFEAYRSKTQDLLLSVALPSTTGFNSQLQNIGSVQNRGVELSLSTINVDRDRFSWRSTLNLAANRNKVLNLGVAQELFVSPRTGNFFSPGELYVVRVGQPLASIYGYRVLGLWQPGDPCYLKNPTSNCVPGEYKIADLNGDSTISAADRTILGYGEPRVYGGLSNTVTYGRFSLDAMFTFTDGNKIINAGKAYGEMLLMQNNERKTALDRWTPTHMDTDVPRANQGRARRLYSTIVEDGSYLRLQTLSLTYELPPGIIPRATSARLYVTGQNLWVGTKYSGFDPEVNSMGGDARFGGIDIGAYPRSRVWNIGASATF
ncbi:MAG TPA: TonB-dependent receptor [Gemmatimonadales bacterium]|jgi:TonB-linked SusC/RagA family outer membrane protein|nr:TonB-dependent receptor [Gemmatimonadales bacterium]